MRPTPQIPSLTHAPPPPPPPRKPKPPTRDLYLARHGQADPHTGALTDQGRHQADLLGHRLQHLTPTALWHGPKKRTTQTAHLINNHLNHHRPQPLPEAGDYAPHLPEPPPRPPPNTKHNIGLNDPLAPHESAPQQGPPAQERFTGPAPGTRARQDVLITHAYLISFLIAHALDAPPWRWVSTPIANAALTVIRYRPHAPAMVVTVNELSHLPSHLHWTGFSPEHRP